MTKKTTEEKFLLRIYELALKEKNEGSGEVNVIALAKEMGIHYNKLNNIVKMLIRSGFIRATKEEKVYLTSKGINLVEDLKK